MELRIKLDYLILGTQERKRDREGKMEGGKIQAKETKDRGGLKEAFHF